MLGLVRRTFSEVRRGMERADACSVISGGHGSFCPSPPPGWATQNSLPTASSSLRALVEAVSCTVLTDHGGLTLASIDVVRTSSSLCLERS